MSRSRTLAFAALAALAAGCTQGGAAGTPGALAGGSTGPGAASTDRTPPAIEIVEPARGSFWLPGATLRVMGRATDPSGVRAVRVDGASVPLAADGTFTTLVAAREGLSQIVVEAEDGRANRDVEVVSYIAGQFLPEGHVHPSGAAARLNRPALSRLSPALASAMRGFDLGAQLARANPVFQASGFWGSARADVTSGSFRDPAVDLDPRAGALGAVLRLRDLRVGFRARVSSFVSIDVAGSITADEALIALDLSASVNPAGRFRVDARTTSVSFTRFQLTLPSVPVVDQLLRDTVRQALEDAISRAAKEQLAPELASGLDQLAAPQARRVFDGSVVTMVFRPERVVHDGNGLGLELGTLFVAPAGPFAPPSPGSLAAARPLAPLSGARGFEMAISDGFLNQLLHATWRSGLLHIPIDDALAAQLLPGTPLDSDLIRFYFPSLRDRIPAGARARIFLDPLLPPVMAIPSASGVAHGDIRLGDVGISIHVDVPGMGAQCVLRGAAQVALPTDIVGQGPMAKIVLDARLARAHADVIEAPAGPVPDAELEAFVEALLPHVVAAATGIIQGFRAPEPAIGAASLTAEAISAHAGSAPTESSIVITGDYR